MVDFSSNVSGNVAIGAFGVGNVGDDLLLFELMRRIKIDYTSGYGIPMKTNLLLPEQIERHVLLDNLEHPLHVIVAGGSFIWSEERLFYLNEVQNRVLKKGGRFSVYWAHVHLGIANARPDVVRKIADQSEHFSTRDSFSRDLITLLGATAQFENDPVFQRAANIRSELRTTESLTRNLRPRIGINAIRTSANFSDFFVDLAKSLMEIDGGCEFEYVSQVEHSLSAGERDSLIFRELRQKFQQNGIDLSFSGHPRDEEDAYMRLLRYDLVVAQRNHLYLMSKGLGINVCMVGSAPNGKLGASSMDYGSGKDFYLIHDQAVLNRISQRLRDALGTS